MKDLWQYTMDDNERIVSVHEANLNINDIVNWISDHGQLYKDYKKKFDKNATVSEVIGWISEHDQVWLDFRLYFNLYSPGDILEDGNYLPQRVIFETSVLDLSDEELQDEDAIDEALGDKLSDLVGLCHYGYKYDIVKNEQGKPALFVCYDIQWDTSDDEDCEDNDTVYNITYEDKNDKRQSAKITVSQYNSINAEQVDFANAILELAETKSVKKIVYIDVVYDDNL